MKKELCCDGQQNLRTWLSNKIAERERGAQAELASFLGIRKEAVSRILKPSVSQGYRLIKAEELKKIIDFFGEAPSGFNPPLPEEREELFSF